MSSPSMVDMELYDDVLELQPEELKKYITFSGTQLTSIVRIRVRCRCDTKNNRYAPAVNYEDLWFRRGDPLGVKHHIPLPIKECDEVAIFVKGKNGGLNDAENAACASSLVLLRLELTLNRNLIATVRVPSETFDGLVNELRTQNFSPYREVRDELKSLIPIQLETDLGRKEVMCFRNLKL